MLAWMLGLILSFSALAEWNIVTYNVRNFQAKTKPEGTDLQLLTEEILKSRADVYAFQEIVDKTTFNSWSQKTFPHYDSVVSNCGGTGKQKLALLYNKNLFDFLSSKELNQFSMGKDPTVCGSLRPALLVNLRDKKSLKIYSIMIVHLKAGSDSRAMERRAEQYKLLSDELVKIQNPYIILGDFNTTGFIDRNADYVAFNNVLKERKLQTSATQTGCTNYWEPTEGRLISSVLDHVLTSKEIQAGAVSVGAHCKKMDCIDADEDSIGDIYHSVSDHCPVKLEVK